MPHRRTGEHHAVTEDKVAKHVAPAEIELRREFGARISAGRVLMAQSVADIRAAAVALAQEWSPAARRGFLSSQLTESERRHPEMRAHLDSIK